MDKIKSAQSMVDQLLDECNIRQVGDNKGALKDIPEDVDSSMDDFEDYILMDEAEEVKVSDVPKDKQKIFKINRGKAREKGGPLTKAEKGGKPIKESDQVKTAQQPDTLFDNEERMKKDKTDKDPSLDPVPNTESTAKQRPGIKIREDLNNVMADKSSENVEESGSINVAKIAAARKAGKSPNYKKQVYRGSKDYDPFSSSKKKVRQPQEYALADGVNHDLNEWNPIKSLSDKVTGYAQKKIKNARKNVNDGNVKGDSTLAKISKRRKMLASMD